MKALKLIVPAAYGTQAYAKKEGNKACIYCHVAAGKKDLNDTGKCYQKSEHKDLDKCPAPAPKK